MKRSRIALSGESWLSTGGLVRGLALLAMVAGVACAKHEPPPKAADPQPAEAQPSATAVIRIGDHDQLEPQGLVALWDATTDDVRARYGGRGMHGFLSDWAERELFVVEAETRGIDHEPAVAARLRLRRSEILYETALERLLLEVVPEADAKAYYESHAKAFQLPPTVVVRMIAVTPKAEDPIPNADQDDAKSPEGAQRKVAMLLSRARYGEDFAELARRFSEDPSATKGGRLELVAGRDLTPQLVAKLERLEPGDISDVIDVGGELRIYRLEERLPARVPPFAEIREQVGRAWLSANRDETRRLYGEVVEKLRAKHPIEIHPERMPDEAKLDQVQK